MKIKILAGIIAVSSIPSMAMAVGIPQRPCAQISSGTSEIIDTGTKRESVVCTQVKGKLSTNTASTATPLSATNTINEPNGTIEYGSYVMAETADITNKNYVWRYTSNAGNSNPSPVGIGGWDATTGKMWDGSEVCKTVNIGVVGGMNWVCGAAGIIRAIQGAYGQHCGGDYWPYSAGVRMAVTACAKVSNSRLLTRITRTAITNPAATITYHTATDTGWKGGTSAALPNLHARSGYTQSYAATAVTFDPNNPLRVAIHGTWYTIPIP